MKHSKPDVNKAASALGKRSAEVRQKKWGKKEFKKRMKEWGKLGGRPKKSRQGAQGLGGIRKDPWPDTRRFGTAALA